MNERVVEPEWLDELPFDEPRAVASRRDLQRLNGLMSHAAIMARALHSLPTPKRILDLGAGDGSFALRLATAAGWQGVEWVLLDRAQIPPGVAQAFQRMDCRVTFVQRDVLDGFADLGDLDCVVTNLFLHHFTPSELKRLLAEVAARCPVFVACEPRRSFRALLASRLVGWIGCNDVTQHDAVASVRAGFQDHEISKLWPHDRSWTLTEHATGLFSHLFMARQT